jgi:PAS domain S-box-containing protein
MGHALRPPAWASGASAFDKTSREAALDEEKIKLLLVDDNADNLVSLEAALESLNQELVPVQSGRDALRQLLDHDFAAILLDVKMPDMDGFETAELIRARKRSEHTPIIFLTGYRNEEHLFRGYHLGAVDFLFKPIVPEVLRSKVAVFVELSRSVRRQQMHAEVLAKAELKFRSLLEAAPDALLITDESGLITLANSRTDSLFGYSRQELLGHNIRELLPSWNFSPEIHVQELVAVHRNSTQFPSEVSFSPLQTEEGLLLTSCVRDITERKRAEQRIAERNKELATLNRELEAFSYSVSHDLRAPLRTIEGFARILVRDYSGRVLDQGGLEHLQRMRSASNRMSQLIEDLLELSRVSRVEIQSERVNLSAIADEAIRELKNRDPERDIEFDLQADMYDVGDPRLLSILLNNLLSNAWKFTSKRASTRIGFHRKPQDGVCCYTLLDNGAGFDPQYADKLFAPFQRLHRASEFEGTGVGLAIVQRVVHRHNGRVWAEGTVGEGAAFHFILGGTVKGE